LFKLQAQNYHSRLGSRKLARKKKENRRCTNKVIVGDRKQPGTDDLLHVRVPVFLVLLALEAMPTSRFPPANANISKISTEERSISYHYASTISSRLVKCFYGYASFPLASCSSSS
jgi:hypothetical protein